jgi:virginiamycin B lyase
MKGALSMDVPRSVSLRGLALPTVLVVAGLTLAACGGSDGASDPGSGVEVVADAAAAEATDVQVEVEAEVEQPAPAVVEAAVPQSQPPGSVASEVAAPDAAVPGDVGRVLEVVEYVVPAGSRPHDVAPAVDGGVWYTAQGAGALGWLDPVSGETRTILLGAGSRPHGVIVGPDGAPWVTDGGLNAIVRVDPASDAVTVFPLPADRPNANLNTATFDGEGQLWFTGQNGVYGRLDPFSGALEVFDAPRGTGPYGIATSPGGAVYYASLAGSYVGQIDLVSGEVTVLDPPTPGQGARRVWSDSGGRIWVSEWNAGALAMFDGESGVWQEWALPGSSPSAYAVYVDELDLVWVSDFGGNALHRFDPATEQFETFTLPSTPGNVRQLLGRTGEVWAPESAADRLVVVRFVSPAR